MGTIISYLIITKQLDSVTKNMSIFGKVLFGIMVVISCIVVFSLALVENILIVPCWLGYNLCHKKEFRKTYVEFLNLKDCD